MRLLFSKLAVIVLSYAPRGLGFRFSTTKVRESAIFAKEEDSNPFLKGVWSGAELLGNIANQGSAPLEVTPSPSSKEEALERLKDDYDNAYFVSGVADGGLYTSDCEFADPFASFRGRDRFLSNLSNLGGFITKADVRPLDFESEEDVSEDGVEFVVNTRQMVKLELNLPWKPVLAWPWRVRHEFVKQEDETFACARHVESWDISAADGVMQVFRPGPEGGLQTGFVIGSKK